ncbi:MAG TPA: MFS transporter [Ktedonobacterales bacterium]|nr:MFS transporter [Ktedonobacterales bacterium]
MGLKGLWRHPDFLKLWAGQTISVFGSLITTFALPVTAILLLKATPLQIMLLSAAEYAPGLLVSFFAGAWVDRLRRRPILIAADLGRAALLGSIPAAALLGALHIEQLYIVALLVSVLAVFFDVAYLSYLPTLVRREELLEGNSKLQASASVAEVAGFGLSGVLVQALTAPVAILIDAVSFVVSACSVAIIRRAEPAPAPSEEQHNAWREIGQGVKLLLGNPILRASAGASGTFNLFRNMVGVVIMLFFLRELNLPPVILGPLFALGGISAFLGALLAERLTRRWGVGRSLLSGLLLSGLATLLIPLAAGPLLVVLGLLAASQLFGDGAATIYEINQTSLIQAMVPDRVQGRINASKRFIEWAAMLLGLLVGGLLGQTIGLRPTLFVAASGWLLSGLWLLFSPVRRLHDYPALEEEPEAALALGE